MPEPILLEQFHLSLVVPGTTPDEVREDCRKVITSKAFSRSLSRAVREVVAKFPVLERVRPVISV
jgi:hypothetical protein